DPIMTTTATVQKQTIEQARAAIPAHVQPKACFVWFVGNAAGYAPIPGTGCAHYVSHKLGLKGGHARCLDGYYVRVPELVAGMTPVGSVDDVRVNDVWANNGL